MSTDSTATARMVAKYRDLISDFIGGRVSAHNFESTYLQVFKTDKDQVPGREFNVLENLFSAVDDYVADPELRKKVSGLGDDELRTSAKEAYAELYEN
ncbi:MAG: colicin immunity domain-containing protein [Mycobacterium sp.]|uniref:colicin immunity domain-containing protein n=1 Tax=Mycobacterium sp. TaxID=1785 RepID=UPI003C5F3543